MSTTDTPANPPLRLRPGAYYRTRNGERVGPITPNRVSYQDAEWAFAADSHPPGYSWKADGRYSMRPEDSMDLVAEWAPTPVQTRTTVRTVIVPGVYGRVKVQEATNRTQHGDVLINLVDRRGSVVHHGADPAYMTTEELRAAAATLTQLADGLDAIAAERNEAK